MAIWALVPVKPFLRSKSRLAGVLSPRARADLSQGFLRRTLAVLAQVPEISQVLVVSRDPAALALARELRAQTLSEAGAPDLNRALTRATQAALAEHAAAVLILPTDLPLLTVADVQTLVAADGAGMAVALAPDRHGAGTNALFVRPPGLLTYAFGPGSFPRHLAQAQAAGAQVRACRLAGLALDVDQPADLAAYQAACLGALDPVCGL
ncbi:MAG: 2-phospho-L-lactate guanylyltransferase [Anaerolineales bacterium]|nr:2-phospho-L-lactate guanylyltransferase [Anaerolineales bacterium]